MFGLFKAFVDPIASVAKEWIETNKEKAEAQVVILKALDPNGKMRRDLSRFASKAYGFYLINTVIFIYMVAFNIGDPEGAKMASAMMQDLFLPITTAWGGIVSASFGVNGVNSYKGN